jgi:hypothetical protein
MAKAKGARGMKKKFLLLITPTRAELTNWFANKFWSKKPSI